MRMIRRLESSHRTVNIPNRSGLYDLVLEVPRWVLTHRSVNRAQIGSEVEGILPDGHSGGGSGGASSPYRILRGEFPGKIQRLFQPPRRGQAGHLDGPNIGDEFSSLELRFQKILPLGRNLIVRDQLSVVGYDCQGAGNAYHVSLDGMNHPWIHLEHILPGHARDVVLHQVRYVFRDKVEVCKGDVPPLRLARLHFHKNSSVSLRAARDLLNLNISDKRILPLKSIYQRLGIRRLQACHYPEFSFLLCPGHDLVMSGKKNVTLSLSVLLGF